MSSELENNFRKRARLLAKVPQTVEKLFLDFSSNEYFMSLEQIHGSPYHFVIILILRSAFQTNCDVLINFLKLRVNYFSILVSETSVS